MCKESDEAKGCTMLPDYEALMKETLFFQTTFMVMGIFACYGLLLRMGSEPLERANV